MYINLEILVRRQYSVSWRTCLTYRTVHYRSGMHRFFGSLRGTGIVLEEAKYASAGGKCTTTREATTYVGHEQHSAI